MGATHTYCFILRSPDSLFLLSHFLSNDALVLSFNQDFLASILWCFDLFVFGSFQKFRVGITLMMRERKRISIDGNLKFTHRIVRPSGIS